MTEPAQPVETSLAPETESLQSKERDPKGVGYIINLIALYGLFFISMIVIAWFGIFSEV